MEELRPGLSSRLAESVYFLTKRETIEKSIKDLNTAFGDILAFSPENMLKAKTGGPAFIKSRTAFGFLLLGKGRRIQPRSA